jgi:hypothetical protein
MPQKLHFDRIIDFIDRKITIFLPVSKIFRIFARKLCAKQMHDQKLITAFYNGTYEYLKSLGIEEI